MSSDFSPELRQELLDDFYAECDELLTNVRQTLTELESVHKTGTTDRSLLETLFRHLHSLKGISAIVGLRAAEELAHAMEDLLRGLTKSTLTLTDHLTELLLSGTQRLEQIVTHHRLGRAPPDPADLIAEAQRLASSGTRATPNLSADDAPAVAKPDLLQQARARGLTLWLGAFTPSPTLDSRGVNLNAVRERLSQLGEIISVTPSVRDQGTIVFEYILGMTEAPADHGAWASDGIQLTRLSTDSPNTSSLPSGSAIPATDFADALSLTPSHIVRVDLSRLDDLLRITGEMVIQRSRLEDRIAQLGNAAAGIREISLALARSLREMREAVARVRLVPVAEIFTRLPFVVRDLARESHKKARLQLEGHQTEIDKFLVERLKEPLLHLVRNAFAHGIELPDERLASGKPAEATIILRATSEGEWVKIQIRDDGRGMQADAIQARARTLGLHVPEFIDANALLAILCTPGFSTREEADRAAGRGVGMAVVSSTVRELGGTLALETWAGVGTEFTLRLPLALSVADAIVVGVGSQICAVAQSAVEEVVQLETTVVRTIQKTEVIPYRGGLLPMVRLRPMFGFANEDAPTVTLLVVSTERGATGLVVDRIHSQRQVVIRPLSDPLVRVPGISGATELGDGRPILILDPAAITQGVVRPAVEKNPLGANASVRHALPT
jgi:two-component system chemotaxis sensor kinase CheA